MRKWLFADRFSLWDMVFCGAAASAIIRSDWLAVTVLVVIGAIGSVLGETTGK